MPVERDSIIDHLNTLSIKEPHGVYEDQGRAGLLLCMKESHASEYACFSQVQVLPSGEIMINFLLSDPDSRSKGFGSYMMHKIERLASLILPDQPVLHSICVRETVPILQKWDLRCSLFQGRVV